jgi:AcrR family transcriptional regulator
MTRPSKNIDKKLIEKGKEYLAKKGIQGINIRAICSKSHINLGMFVYCFKSKEKYVKILFNSLIEDYEKRISSQLENLSDAMERLKVVVFETLKFFRDKKETFENIIKEMRFSNKNVSKAHKIKQKQWLDFLITLIEDCKRDGYIKKDMDNFIAISFIIGSITAYAKLIQHEDSYSDEEFYKKINAMILFVESKLK